MAWQEASWKSVCPEGQFTSILRPSCKLEHDWYFLYCNSANRAFFTISQLLQEEEFRRHALADHRWLRAQVNSGCAKIGVEWSKRSPELGASRVAGSPVPEQCCCSPALILLHGGVHHSAQSPAEYGQSWPWPSPAGCLHSHFASMFVSSPIHNSYHLLRTSLS